MVASRQRQRYPILDNEHKGAEADPVVGYQYFSTRPADTFPAREW